MDCGWTTNQSNHNSIWVHSIIIITLGWVDSVAQQQTLVERNGTVLFVAVLVVKKYYWQRILPKEVFQGENGSGLINIDFKTKEENWIEKRYFLNYVLHHRQVCFCQSTFRFKSPSFLLHLYFFISSTRQIEPHFIILLKSETFCLTIKCSNKTEKVKLLC